MLRVRSSNPTSSGISWSGISARHPTRAMIAVAAKGWGIMRRRLGKFLPIVMFAMLVQIFAPVAACLAFSNAVADPLAGAICSHVTDANSSQDGQTDPRQAQGNCCALCGTAHSATPTADPQVSVVKVEPDVNPVVWRDLNFTLPAAAVGSNAQARGPPSIS